MNRGSVTGHATGTSALFEQERIYCFAHVSRYFVPGKGSLKRCLVKG